MNCLRREVSHRWIYAGIGVAIIAIFSFPVSQIRTGEQDLSKFPALSSEELRAEHTAVFDEVMNGEITQPEGYWRTLHRVSMLVGSAKRAMYDDLSESTTSHGSTYDAFPNFVATSEMDLTSTLLNRYENAFPGGAVGKTREAFIAEHPELDTEGLTFASGGSSGYGWGVAYLWSMPLMGMFFFVRLRSKGFSPYIELIQGWKLAGAVATWPIAMWKYPNGDPARQLASALRMASYVIITMLSLGGGGAIKAGTSKSSGDKKDGSKAPYALISDDEAGTTIDMIPDDEELDLSFVYGLRFAEQYLVDAGQVFHPDPVVQQFLGITIKPGSDSSSSHYLEYWRSDGETSAFDTFAREDDLAYMYSYSVSDRASVTAGVLYVSVNDNSSNLKGVIQPRVGALFRAGPWSLSTMAKYAFVNRGADSNGGLFLEVGASRAVPLGNGFSFRTNSLITYDVDGAFGFDPAITLRNTPGFAWSSGDRWNVGLEAYVEYQRTDTPGHLTDGRENALGNARAGVTISF